MQSFTLGIAMLGVFALIAGGIYMVAKRRDVRKGMLMLICAFVLFMNVLILTA